MTKFFKFKEILSLIFAISSFILMIDTDTFIFDKSDIAIKASVFNIIALVLGIIGFSHFNDNYYFFKKTHGNYSTKDQKNLNEIEKILHISSSEAIYFVERTSSIAGQLVKNFSLFLWPLIVFYLLNIFKDNLYFNDTSEFSMHSNLSAYLKATNSRVGFWYIILSGLANIFNFISAIGLWVCFSILYQKTLDSENKSSLHFGLYHFLLIVYVLSYILLIGAGDYFGDLSLQYSILFLDLFCSIFNGIAMILFFNRLVQILYFFQKPLKKNLLDKYYFYIAVIIFPIYACSQLFFGLFDQLKIIREESIYEIVKSFVFYVCFIGKLFLILFLYSFIKTKWLHAAIISLLVNERTPSQLASKVDGISNEITTLDMLSNSNDE